MRRVSYFDRPLSFDTAKRRLCGVLCKRRGVRSEHCIATRVCHCHAIEQPAGGTYESAAEAMLAKVGSVGSQRPESAFSFGSFETLLLKEYSVTTVSCLLRHGRH